MFADIDITADQAAYLAKLVAADIRQDREAGRTEQARKNDGSMSSRFVMLA